LSWFFVLVSQTLLGLLNAAGPMAVESVEPGLAEMRTALLSALAAIEGNDPETLLRSSNAYATAFSSIVRYL
jgi:hypothetical protein